MNKKQQQRLFEFIARQVPLYSFYAGEWVMYPPDAMFLMIRAAIEEVDKASNPPVEEPVYAAWLKRPYTCLATNDRRLIVSSVPGQIREVFGSSAEEIRLKTVPVTEWFDTGSSLLARKETDEG